MNRFILICLFISTGFLSANAQANEKTELSILNTLYNEHIDSSAFLYTGAEYITQAYPKVGNPFFLVDSLSEGSIRYAGQLYNGVGLQWDVMQNYVLVPGLNGMSKIILQNDLIDSFTIGSHTIIKMVENKAANLQNTDFYDVLYRGETGVFARRQKSAVGVIKDDRVVYYFRNHDKFYVKKKGTFYRVSNKREALRIFSAHTGAINRAIRKENLNWRKDFEACLVVAAIHYDQLTD